MAIKLPQKTLSSFCFLAILLPSPLLLLLPVPCESANFLFSFFHDAGSHFGSMRPLMESLAKRGHSVTLLDTSVYNKDASPLLRHIKARLPLRDDDASKVKFAKALWNGRMTSRQLALVYREMDDHFGTLLLNHSEKIVELLNTDWDFIVLDDLCWSFGFALGTLKHRLWELSGKQGKHPHLVFYATAAQSLASAESVKSVGRNWVSRAPMFTPFPKDSTDAFSPNHFSHRLLLGFYENAMEYVFINIVSPWLMPHIAAFGVPNFSWYDMFSRQSLALSDSVDRIGWPAAVGTDIINVGAHCKQPSAESLMSEEMRDFVEQPRSKGTIYVAFGTLADLSRAPGHVTDALFGALNRLTDYRVILVSNGQLASARHSLGPHVLLTGWAPQLEILAHPRTRVFISHGGNKSVREALCAGVPLIVMPIYAEQAHTAQLLLGRGLAQVLNKFTLREHNVFSTVHGVVSNPESWEKAKKLQRMFRDRPIPALDEGAFAMERLFRKEGAADHWRRFTQRQGIHLDWARFAFLDWLAVLAGICCLLLK